MFKFFNNNNNKNVRQNKDREARKKKKKKKGKQNRNNFVKINWFSSYLNEKHIFNHEKEEAERHPKASRLGWLVKLKTTTTKTIKTMKKVAVSWPLAKHGTQWPIYASVSVWG